MAAHPKLCVTDLKARINDLFDNKALESLKEFIRIPNITKHSYSSDPVKWQNEGYPLLLQAANHLKTFVDSLEIKGCTCEVKPGSYDTLTPIVLTTIEGTVGTVEETYFFYGHFDKQPEMGKWSHEDENGNSGAHVPIILKTEDSVKLIGRGGADDGYATYATMIAIKALQDQGVQHPRFVMLTEGDEESGSGHVEQWVQLLTKELGTPKMVFCLDSGGLDYNRFFLTNSLRGYCAIQFTIKVLDAAIHSGSGTGIVPTCHRIIRNLINRIEDINTGEMPLFDVEIPNQRQEEITKLIATFGKGAVKTFPTVQGLQYPLVEIEPTIKLNTWRAQLETLTIDGYPDYNQSSNVITPWLSIKLSLRLPPTFPPQDAKNLVIQKLTTNIPHNAQIIFDEKTVGAESGFNAPYFTQNLKTIVNNASQEIWGEDYIAFGEGGSIPFMEFLKTRWPKAQFIVSGVLGPDSNAHGPDESLDLPYVKELIAAVGYIIYYSIPEFFPQVAPKFAKLEKVHKKHPHGHKKEKSLEKPHQGKNLHLGTHFIH